MASLLEQELWLEELERRQDERGMEPINDMLRWGYSIEEVIAEMGEAVATFDPTDLGHGGDDEVFIFRMCRDSSCAQYLVCVDVTFLVFLFFYFGAYCDRVVCYRFGCSSVRSKYLGHDIAIACIEIIYLSDPNKLEVGV